MHASSFHHAHKPFIPARVSYGFDCSFLTTEKYPSHISAYIYIHIYTLDNMNGRYKFRYLTNDILLRKDKEKRKKKKKYACTVTKSNELLMARKKKKNNQKHNALDSCAKRIVRVALSRRKRNVSRKRWDFRLWKEIRVFYNAIITTIFFFFFSFVSHFARNCIIVGRGN